MSRKFDLNRNVGQRRQRRKLYLYMEGTNTEPEYFRFLEQLSVATTVDLIFAPGQGAPTTLLARGRAKKSEITSRKYIRENGEGDEVWLVFDRDDHPNVPLVINEANKLSIGVAFSDPCFELWLILHFRDYDKDEPRHLTQLLCESVCEGYSRTTRKTPKLRTLLPKVADAMHRAVAMRARRLSDGGSTPFTSVDLLVRAIRGE